MDWSPRLSLSSDVELHRGNLERSMKQVRAIGGAVTLSDARLLKAALQAVQADTEKALEALDLQLGAKL